MFIAIAKARLPKAVEHNTRIALSPMPTREALVRELLCDLYPGADNN
jgi:hypothetical protein